MGLDRQLCPKLDPGERKSLVVSFCLSDSDIKVKSSPSGDSTDYRDKSTKQFLEPLLNSSS